MGTAPAVVATAAAPRIHKIEVSDFRAFPATCPGKFDLGETGKNLLIFGENGSGKSSLYRALRGLFSTSPESIIDSRNVFTQVPQPSVRVCLTGNVPDLTWDAAGHPTALVRDTARRSAFLTYTRLREMNTGITPNLAPNLFRVAVEHLLADFEATVTGGVRKTIAELWTAVGVAVKERKITAGGPRVLKGYNAKVQAACDLLDEGMNQAITALEEQAKPLLTRLLDTIVTDGTELIGLTYFGPQFDGTDRENPPEGKLTATVRFRTHQPVAPQNFLNEARQSALGIAIYLAGRLACVPSTAPELKLLVLDDLLISLDASHRYPILAAITELFVGWQIILLTHDRDWFEAAREKLEPTDAWKAVAIYEAKDGDDLLVPLIRPMTNDPVKDMLDQAEAFLAEHHPAAAANYARSACELTLKRYCIRHAVEFPYFEDAKRPDLNTLLDRAKRHAVATPDRHASLVGLERHRRYVLNPLSHDPLTPVPEAEVRDAIVAVRLAVTACVREPRPRAAP